jgi:LytS/YehU family sensor histidine kinase
MAPRRTPVLAAVGAGLGAIGGALLGFFSGWAIGVAVGLPRYRLGDDPEGFDTLDAAVLALVVAWVAGAVVGSRLATRSRPRPSSALTGAAVIGLAFLALGATMVGSGNADWYHPIVFFVAPPLLMGLAAVISERGAATQG